MTRESLHKSIINTDNKHVSRILEALVIDVAGDVFLRATRTERSRDSNDETLSAAQFLGDRDFGPGRVLVELYICMMLMRVIYHRITRWQNKREIWSGRRLLTRNCIANFDKEARSCGEGTGSKVLGSLCEGFSSCEHSC